MALNNFANQLPESPEAIAYLLAYSISHEEKPQEKNRAYYLTLYQECLAAVRGK